MEPKTGHPMSNLKIRFGKRLKELRTERGLTQEKLAEACDTTRDTIRNIESGKHGPRFGLMEKILKILKVKPKDFFNF